MGYMKFKGPLIQTQPGIWQLKCDLLLLLIPQKAWTLQSPLQTVSGDLPLVGQMSNCKPDLYWY